MPVNKETYIIIKFMIVKMSKFITTFPSFKNITYMLYTAVEKVQHSMYLR